MFSCRIFLPAALLVVAGGLLPRPNASATDLYVPGQYTSISEAVAAAGIGDTIRVAEGTYQEQQGLGINKPLTITGETAGAQPTIEIIGQSTTDGIIVTADDVTLENMRFYRASHTSYHAIIAVPKGGPWPDYIIEHARLTLRNCTIEGGRYGAYLHVEDLTVENCTFYDTYRDSLILAAVSGTTTITSNDFIGDNYEGKKAILVEGGTAQPYVSGAITVDYNTCVGKRNFLVYSHWGGTADKVDLTISHNSVDSIGSVAVSFYAAYTDDPSAFSKFNSIALRDNIVSNSGLAVYVDYEDWGWAPPPENRPVPADGQIVVSYSCCDSNSADENDTTDPGGNLGYYDVSGMTPPGASMAMYSLSDNIAGDPAWNDPSHTDDDFSIGCNSAALDNASDSTDIGAAQGSQNCGGPPPPTIGIYINFQLAGSTVPESYQKDDGSHYGIKSSGWSFGWLY